MPPKSYYPTMYLARTLPRLGKREKFENLDKAQVHAVGTAAMNHAGQSVLENVKGYDPSLLDTTLTQEVELATLLDKAYIGILYNKHI